MLTTDMRPHRLAELSLGVIDLGVTDATASQRSRRSPLRSIAVGVGLAWLLAGCANSASPGAGTHNGSTKPPTPSSGSSLKVSAQLAPWQLAAGISRSVALAQGAHHILILGGMDSAGSSVSGVFSMSTVTGKLTPAGSLASSTHDAAGAVLNGKWFLFGGGSNSVYSAVQQWVPGGTAKQISTLPQPRADLSSTQDSHRAYIVGGYDGSSMDSAVLSTTNGVSFQTVAKLPLPVRYAATAVLGHTLFVIGGENGGQATDLVQTIDLSTGSVAIAGHFPVKLADAQAAVLNGQLLVAGGQANGQISKAVWALSKKGDSFSTVANLPLAVSNSASVVQGGTLWLIGGENPSAVSTVVEIHSGT